MIKQSKSMSHATDHDEGAAELMNPYVHLHVKSEYSLLNSAATINELVAAAAKQGMTALALTDRSVMYGAIPFYQACQERDIKPIIGCQIVMVGGGVSGKVVRADTPLYHLTLLAKNKQGYQNLMALCSLAHLAGTQREPVIDWSQLKAHATGLICLSSGRDGELAHLVLSERWTEAVALATQYQQLFGSDYYLECQDHGIIEEKKMIKGFVQLHKECGIPLVATNDVRYVRQEDHGVHDVLLCIGTGRIIDEIDRVKLPTEQYYFRTADEMRQLFAYLPEAIRNTQLIAEKCELSIELGQPILPKFEPLPAAQNAAQYLHERCQQGLRERYNITEQWQSAEFRQQLQERLTYELSVIESMGYADYFLIVWDFIRFAHEQGIRVGPGRGSSAGSLVAYVLRITDVDPIRYRLLFERFLNPERISMPDIDIDFDDERRDEVIAYVVSKYGADRVAQIATFGTMAARAAIRDVGRVLNLPIRDVDRVAKMIPNHVGMTIEKALTTNPDLQAFIEESEEHAAFIAMARKVEGLPRHVSTHAAGVVISKEPLTHYVPLQAGTELTALTQYSMDHLQAIGLLKMDFLGLRTLSIIERSLQWIAEHEGETIDFSRISDRDQRTYELVSRGDTAGVFQMESGGMRRVLRELRPSEFEDIISVLALYRPGPMDFIPQYIQGKHGQIKVQYPHPSLQEILSDTYGIIVYQEQIMQIASTMAGFSLAEADLLRRAVSKKERAVLDEERGHFVTGSITQGYDEADAHKVYDMIVRFADYGFPRAHAAAYGVLAYQTAYLKANYAVYFLASLLTAVRGSQQKVAEYVDECRRMNITVLPPDVNHSGMLFEPIAPGDDFPNGAIRFGLAAIKNVGTLAMQSIIHERKQSSYASLIDLCRRVDLKVCNKRVIESLIQSGALDTLPGHRAQLLAMLDETIETALKWKKEREDLQISMFGLSERINWTIDYPDVHPFPKLQQLQMERELLGLYVSGHPLDTYQEQLDGQESDPIHLLNEHRDDQLVQVVGMVLSMRMILTRQGKQMAFAEIEDRIAKVETVIFPKVWDQCRDWFAEGSLVMMRARLQREDETIKLLADQIYPLELAIERQLLSRPIRVRPSTSERHIERGRRQSRQGANRSNSAAVPQRASAPVTNPTKQPIVFIKIAKDKEQEHILENLQAILLQHHGHHQVILFYEQKRRRLALGPKFHVMPTRALFNAVETLLGKGSIRMR